MDQKNTIVKCTANPNCLFNHNGICDNYVITIGADGSCQEYVETEDVYTPPSAQEILEYTIKLEQEKLRGQRAKCNFYEDTCDDKPIIKTPDPKNMDIHFIIQNAQWNEEFLRDQMCWFCDNGQYGKCKLTTKPALDRTGKCPCYKSTGGNR